MKTVWVLPFALHAVRQEPHRALLLQLFGDSLIDGYEVALELAASGRIVHPGDRQEAEVQLLGRLAHRVTSKDKVGQCIAALRVAFAAHEGAIDGIHRVMEVDEGLAPGVETWQQAMACSLPLWLEYTHDENIALFWLQRAERLDRLMGEGYTQSWLTPWQGSIPDLERWLVVKYQQRGFCPHTLRLHELCSHVMRWGGSPID